MAQPARNVVSFQSVAALGCFAASTQLDDAACTHKQRQHIACRLPALTGLDCVHFRRPLLKRWPLAAWPGSCPCLSPPLFNHTCRRVTSCLALRSRSWWMRTTRTAAWPSRTSPARGSRTTRTRVRGRVHGSESVPKWRAGMPPKDVHAPMAMAPATGMRAEKKHRVSGFLICTSCNRCLASACVA